jgi:uncharacterized membrane protein YoaK (UPF0700 family)
VQVKRGLLLLLAFVGGWVDAVGFVVLLHLFTGHMSGNSIAMSVYLGEGVWGEALRRAFPIPLFVLGVALGAICVQVLARREVRAVFVAPLALEALLLLLFAALGEPLLGANGIAFDPPWRFYLLAAMPALAMGVQNATLRRAGGETVHTTYVTGLLTDLGEKAVSYGFARCGMVNPQSSKVATLQEVLWLLGVWLAYVAGGCLGALTEMYWQLWCLLIPVGCLLVVMAYDYLWPLAPGSAAGK